jgi:hypothetical protein
MGLRPSVKHSLDRLDNSWGYEPGNCAWRTTAEQASNKRQNKAVIRDDGVRFPTIKSAAECAGVNFEQMRWASKVGKKLSGHTWRQE